MSDHARLPADTCNDKKAGPFPRGFRYLEKLALRPRAASLVASWRTSSRLSVFRAKWTEFGRYALMPEPVFKHLLDRKSSSVNLSAS
jgi:hypothetical protein